MKKFFVSLCMVASCMFVHAQDCAIPMQVVVPDDVEGMTPLSANYIKNVLNRVLVGGNDVAQFINCQFGIVVKPDIVEKHIIAGSPQKTVLNLSLTLYIGDIQQGTLFSSYTMDVNGVGDNDTKAYNSAIRRLNAQNRNLNDFIDSGKKKIIEWYDNNYQNIIMKAKTAASIRNYEEALYELLSIPECSTGYAAAVAQIKIVYQEYIDRQCEENLAQAQAAWMTGFSKENAAVASVFLSEIYPDAACYGDAMQLVAEIKKHMGEEWKFEMKQWSDLASIESQRLTYAREIAMAYAQNQPQQIIHLLYR
ncbi:MAG: hypothetical protein LUC91_05375 [Prevotella sp.]|nr:hypothetical protein [Prevotella sp.]